MPPLARRPRHQKPTPAHLVLFAGRRAKGARRCSLRSGCRHCPEPAGQQRPCRSPVRWGCAGQGRPGAAPGGGGAVALALQGRQAAALGAALPPAECGWPEVPAPSRGEGAAGQRPRGTVLPKVKMLPCLRAAASGRRRRQETGGSLLHRAAPRSNLCAGDAASCPAQGAMVALGTMDPRSGMPRAGVI